MTDQTRLDDITTEWLAAQAMHCLEVSHTLHRKAHNTFDLKKRVELKSQALLMNMHAAAFQEVIDLRASINAARVIAEGKGTDVDYATLAKAFME